MKRQVLPLESVREELDGYVLVEINLARDDRYAGRYRVQGAPSFLILDSDGQVKASRWGYVAPDDFIRFLQGASASFRSPDSESSEPGSAR